MVGRHSGGYESTYIGISGVKDGGRRIRVGILILIRPKTFLRVICGHF